MHQTAGRLRRFNHVFGASDIDPIGITPRGSRSDQSAKVDDGIVALGSSDHRFSIAKISKDVSTVCLTRVPLKAGHLVTSSSQHGGERTSKEAGAAGDKDLHRLTDQRGMS